IARIRRARPGDAPTIARLANALNRHERLRQRFTPAIVRRDAFGRRPHFRVLIAEVDRCVVGYASFALGYNTDIAAPELFMHDLFVLARSRSRGLGRMLVAAVAGEAVRRRLTCLEWGVRGDNARARRFYRRLGARVSDMRTASLAGPALRTIAARR
ncbi:MAG TPA: GNAT family N-acetyltransferase, partial [Methylomirabilota bacterium]